MKWGDTDPFYLFTQNLRFASYLRCGTLIFEQQVAVRAEEEGVVEKVASKHFACGEPQPGVTPGVCPRQSTYLEWIGGFRRASRCSHRTQRIEALHTLTSGSFACRLSRKWWRVWWVEGRWMVDDLPSP